MIPKIKEEKEMNVSMPCPKCGGHEFDPFDDCSGMLCCRCSYFVIDAEIEVFAKKHPECKDVQRIGKEND